MAWDREEFLAIINTNIGIKLLNDSEINDYTAGWSLDNKAALMHANGITEDSDFEHAKQLMQLVAAFGKKNLKRLKELVDVGVSVGARLDYLLPLYDAKYGAGEDVFVTSTKVILGGNKDKDVQLKFGDMQHLVGENAGNAYLENELKELEDYVNNSFEIQTVLQNAPDKTIIQPTPEAVQYIIENAKIYRDSNHNPTIVFIPGAISIDHYSALDLISLAIKYGAYIDDRGFFGVSGIVWSILLADVEAVKYFLECDANINMQDEMHNPSVIAWVNSTLTAMQDSQDYCDRLNSIKKDITLHEGISTQHSEAQSNQLTVLRKNSYFKPHSTDPAALNNISTIIPEVRPQFK